jgi:eukaryotic-like serine/threonine-protein kinase
MPEMALSPTAKLGPYEIKSQIGAGGMGEVYRARDARLNRDVALKIMPESFARDADRLRRFEQESKAVAALNHPNIVAIYDVGEYNGSPYLVSELLEGENLRTVINHGPIPPRKVVEYAVQVANGLAAAHAKGVVHRDLKPENFFVCRDGRVKILDFGLAKLGTKGDPELEATMTSSHTAAGVVMGTASYMSPEQVRGEAVDARTDMFAFGAVLYEMLSGKRAFQRDTPPETMTAILRDDVPEMADLQPPPPPALDRIVRRCLEKNPEQRFQSAKDLAFGLEALSQLSGSGGVTSAQAAIAAAGPAPQKKIAWAAVGVVLAAAIGFVGWWIGHQSGTSAQPQYTEITFRTGAVSNARFAPDGSVVYAARWAGVPQQLYIARPGDAGSAEVGLKDAELLAVSKSGELAVRLRSVFAGGYSRWGTLARLPMSGGSPREVLEYVQDATFAADGETMAVVRYVPENHHWRLEYPIGKVLVDTINWISEPSIAPDGKTVAFADHENPGGDDMGAVAIVDLEGHERKLSDGWDSVEGIYWTPSGDELWFAASDSGAANQLRAVTMSGKVRAITNVPGGMWLQDLRNGTALILSHRQRQDLHALPPGAKEEVNLSWLGWSSVRDVSLDGKKVLFEEEAEGGGPNYTVFLRDTDGSPPVRLGEGIARAISPDGKWVVTSPHKDGDLYIIPTGAGEPRQLTHDTVAYGGMRYLPDGKHLVAGGLEPGHGARVYMIDVATGTSKAITPEGISGGRPSPDGQRLIVEDGEGKFGIWTIGGASMTRIPGLENPNVPLGWTPDGQSLLVFDTSARETGTSMDIYRVNIATGKRDFWKAIGASAATGTDTVGPPQFSRDLNSYVYGVDQILSEAFVVKGLK